MKRILLILALLIGYCTSAHAVIATTTTYISNTKIMAAVLNANNNNLVNAINNIESVNIVNGTILGTDIHAGTIAASNMYCSGYWSTLTNCGGTGAIDANALHIHTTSATTHGNLSAATSTMHSDLSIKLTDTGSKFASTTTNISTAISDLAAYVGYSSATTATATFQVVYSGYGQDDVTYYDITTGNATPTISIDVATGTATNGIVVDISANMEVACGAGSCVIDIPLAINGVALSQRGTIGVLELYKYVLSTGSNTHTTVSSHTKRVIYTTADGWNPNIKNTVSLGSPYVRIGSSGCAGTGNTTVNYFNMILYLLR